MTESVIKNLRQLLMHDDEALRKQGLELFRVQDLTTCKSIFKRTRFTEAIQIPFLPSPSYGSNQIINEETLWAFLMGPDGKAGERWRKTKKFSSKTSLWLRGNTIRNVDALALLVGLESLNLSNCTQLENVDGLIGLSKLTSLNLGGCKALENIDGLAGLINLTSLDLSDCTSLKNLDGLAELTNLTSLKLESCYSLKNIDGLAGLTNLTSLDLGYCESLESVDALAGLTNLTSLYLGMCSLLRGVDGLAHLPHLNDLNLYDCQLDIRPPVDRMSTRDQVETFQSMLSGDTNAEVISLRAALVGQVTERTNALKTLRDGPVSLCQAVFQGLKWNSVEQQPSIENYRSATQWGWLPEIPWCDDFNIHVLAALVLGAEQDREAWRSEMNLDTLGCLRLPYDAHSEPKLVSEILTQLSSLHSLTAPKSGFVSTEFLQDAPQLAWLNLEASKIESLNGLGHLRELKFLSLHECNHLSNSDLDELSNLESLRSLNLADSGPINGRRTNKAWVTDLSALRSCTAIESLNLAWQAPNNLEALGNMTKLMDLNLCGCVSLRNVNGIIDLPNLNSVNMRYGAADNLPSKPSRVLLQGNDIKDYQAKLRRRREY